MKFKEMQIEINESQALKEIFLELKRIGYDSTGYVFELNHCGLCVVADGYGYFTVLRKSLSIPVVSLKDLKSY